MSLDIIFKNIIFHCKVYSRINIFKSMEYDILNIAYSISSYPINQSLCPMYEVELFIMDG